MICKLHGALTFYNSLLNEIQMKFNIFFHETLFCVTTLVLLLLTLFNNLETTLMNYHSKVEMKFGTEIMIKLPSNEHLVCAWLPFKCLHLLFNPRDNALIG